jgi:ABC-2 type transport system permease protein
VNTGLENMLASYGVIINKDLVLDKNCFRTTHKLFGEQDIYFAPLIKEDKLHRENVITKYLNRIFFIKASSLDLNQEVIKNQNIKDTVLVSSSDSSWVMRGRINYNPMMMRPPDESRMKSYRLALLLSGEFESFFKNREAPKADVKANEGEKKSKDAPVTSVEVIAKSVKPVKIVVLGTSEVTANNIIDRDGKSPNAIFLHNVIDYLNGNYDIPEMRTKGIEFNPLKETSEGIRLVIKILNIAGLPILVILLGLLMWKLRNRRKKRIMVEFGGEATNE